MGKAKKTKSERAQGNEQHHDEAATAPASPDRLAVEELLGSLATNPDFDELLAANPSLTIDDVKQMLARARETLHNLSTIRRQKSTSAVRFENTQGLPEPDGALHKGNIFRALLAPLKPGKMLDLGAGKGNFSLTAAEMGWQVTAVDARTVRWPDPDAQEDPGVADLIRSVRWVQSDVREFPIGRDDYDLICILGLLHHLEVPDQVALLTRCAGTALILDTRVAPAIVDRDGDYEGMVIREHGETREERDEVPTASWGNATSFRHTEESLVRLLRGAGFPQVMMMRPPHRRDYTYYLALPRAKTEEIETSARRSKKRKTIGHGRGGKLWSHWVPDESAAGGAPAEPAADQPGSS